MSHALPPLGYSFDALEPYIDARTMEIHHDKHHAGYVKKLNAALEGHQELEDKPIEELIKNLNSISEEIRTAIRNNGGGHYNHSLFWPLLKTDVDMSRFAEISEAVKKDFESFETFKEQFTNAALTQFGSGWAWLVVNPANGNKLEVVKTPNQDNPLTDGKIPILMIDVWEHAYYLKYQNKRAEYVENFFNVINWEKVNENFLKATQVQ
jgi:Fe-Mn family superoxide dismutase